MIIGKHHSLIVGISSKFALFSLQEWEKFQKEQFKLRYNYKKEPFIVADKVHGHDRGE